MSEIRVTTLKDTSGSNSSTTAEIASGRAKAWVNFNGVGVVAIRAQFNVNSVADNGGSGDYTVTFSNAMVDANYVVVTSSDRQGGDIFNTNQTAAAPTASAIRLQAYNRADTFTATDITHANVAIFR